MRPGDIGDGADRLPGPRESVEAPIDLDAVRADDDLIEALAAGLVPPPTGRPDPDDVDEQLVALLAGWVADVRPETLLHRPGDPPPPDLTAAADIADAPDAESDAELPAEPVTATAGDEPGLDTAPIPATVRSISTGRHRLRRTGVALVTRFAAAAVLVVLVVSGVVAGAWGAKPGTVLWPVTQIVFAQKARSVQAATDVTTSLERARAAIMSGHAAEAQAALAVVLAQLPDVADADGHDVLAAQTSEVGQQLVTSDSRPGASSSDKGRTVLASGSAGAVITTTPALPDGVGRSRGAPEPPPAAAAALPGPTAGGTGTTTTGSTGTAPGDPAPGDTSGGTTSGGTTSGGSTPGGPPSSDGPVVTIIVTPPPAPPTSVVPPPPPVTTEPPAPSSPPSDTPTDTGTPGGNTSNSTPSDTGTTGGTGSSGASSTPDSGSVGSSSGSGGSTDSGGSGSSGGGGATTDSGGSGGGADSSGSGSSGGGSGSSGSTDSSSSNNGSSGGSALGAAADATTGTINTIAGVLT